MDVNNVCGEEASSIDPNDLQNHDSTMIVHLRFFNLLNCDSSRRSFLRNEEGKNRMLKKIGANWIKSIDRNLVTPRFTSCSFPLRAG